MFRLMTRSATYLLILLPLLSGWGYAFRAFLTRS